jgi:hypothetical protein
MTPASTRRQFVLGGASLLLGGCVQRRPDSHPNDAAASAVQPAPATRRPEPRAAPLIYDDHGGLLIEVAVEGRGPKRLLLDTGASCSTLASVYVAELGLATHSGEPVEGTAGVVESLVARASIDVPGLGVRTVDAAVYDFTSYDPECIGVLGNDVLAERPFRVEYRPARITWDALEPDDTIPLELDHGIPRIAIEIGGVALDVRLDTGAALAPGPDFHVNLTRAQAAAVGLTGAPLQVWSATGTGGARLELPVHAIAELRIGTLAIPRAFAIVQPPIGYFARADAVGFLGNSALDKLDPWFDYGGRVFGITARR